VQSAMVLSGTVGHESNGASRRRTPIADVIWERG
jgi:hypothetical protein